MKKICFFLMLCFSMTLINTFASSGDIVIHIQNEQQKRLKDVVLLVTNHKTNVTQRYQSNADGEIMMKGLQVASYGIEIEEYKDYAKQARIDFDVTPYTIEYGTTLTIVLQHTTNQEKNKDYRILYLLFAILNGLAYACVAIFKNKTFTQFIDEIMV